MPPGTPLSLPQPMGFQSQRPKSPLKKHTQYAATAQWTMIVSPSQSPRQRQQSDASNARAKVLRAELVQTMLSLTDQSDEAMLQGHVAILQQLSSLALGNPRVRNSCLDMLRQLKLSTSSATSSTDQEDVLDLQTVSSLSSMSSSSSSSSSSASSASSPFVYEHAVLEASDDEDQEDSGIRVSPKQVRDSGRPRCSTLNASPQFLRASANEVHELDDQSPAFDYAETCGSETDASARHRKRRGRQQNQQLLHPLRLPTLTFDYASSTIDGASSLATGLDDEDLRADQGSQFSEVLLRAEYLSQSSEDEKDLASSRMTEALDTLQAVRTRMLCRQVLRRFRLNNKAKDNRPAQSLATKFRVFDALKTHRAQSPRNLARKALVFTRLKHQTMAKAQQPTQQTLTLIQPSRLMHGLRMLAWRNLELLGLVLLVYWAALSVE